MGTKHLTVVVSNKKVKVAQYGQWDGYPTGQGETILRFLRSRIRYKKLDKFREQLEQTKFIDNKRLNDCWQRAGADKNSDFVTMAVSENFRNLFPGLSRDTGAEVLELIYKGRVTELTNSYDFAADSCFCEYAYVIDLDKEVLEVYTGFSRGKAKGRFAKMKPVTLGKETTEFSPVTLFKKIKFSDLTSDTMKKLEKELSKDDE